MDGQTLDNNEILLVRWATEDPNPKSKVAIKREHEEKAAEAVLQTISPEQMQMYQMYYQEELNPKRSRADGEVAAVGYYPETDQQYYQNVFAYYQQYGYTNEQITAHLVSQGIYPTDAGYSAVGTVDGEDAVNKTSSKGEDDSKFMSSAKANALGIAYESDSEEEQSAEN